MTEVLNDGKGSSLPAVVNNENGATVVALDPKEDDMQLKFFDKSFVYDMMSIPTVSRGEGRLVNYVKFFAMRNNIHFEFDDYGNIYLTKGELAEGEFYPCVTSHLDSVQRKHEPYAAASVNLELKTVRQATDNTHKVYVDGMGIGADDKGGICISLWMFMHLDKLKACFFLEEEIGCLGSSKLNKEWFKDVGYVLGFDSPELNRAAWSCSGAKLFTYDFYEKFMKKTCDKWGLTRFESEPFTDVKQIREKTEIVCMNFGNGGYNAHGETEYFIMEEMDHAGGMGLELIKELGLIQYKLTSTSEYGRSELTLTTSNGLSIKTDNLDDNAKLRKLGKYTYTSGYGGYSGGYSNSSSYSGNSTLTKAKEEEIRFETLKYLVKRYDDHIDAIKGGVMDAIKEVCKDHEIDFGLFEKAVEECFSNTIKF